MLGILKWVACLRLLSCWMGLLVDFCTCCCKLCINDLWLTGLCLWFVRFCVRLLSRYCQCFAQQISCNPACRCMQCVNTGTNDALVQAAVRAILERNPNAFESKFKPVRCCAGLHAQI